MVFLRHVAREAEPGGCKRNFVVLGDDDLMLAVIFLRLDAQAVFYDICAEAMR